MLCNFYDFLILFFDAFGQPKTIHEFGALRFIYTRFFIQIIYLNRSPNLFSKYI